MAATAKFVATHVINDQASGPAKEIAAEVTRMADAEEKAGKKIVGVSSKVTKSKKANIAVSKQVALAVRLERASGDKLATTLVNLERQWEGVEAQLKANARAGRQVDQALVREAASARELAKSLRTADAEMQRSAASSARAGKSFGSTGLSVGAMSKQIVAGAAAYATLGAAVRLARGSVSLFVTDVVSVGDELDKASKRIGISTAALQEFRFAGERSGIGADKLTAALSKLQKAAFDSASGSKAMSQAFEDIGVKVDDSNKRLKSADVLFGEVAEGLSKVESMTERAGLAMTIFGKSGSALIPLLSEGAEGVGVLQERYRELGAVMSDELIASSADYADATLDLSKAMLGLRNELSTEVIPALVDVANAVTSAVVAFNHLIGLKNALRAWVAVGTLGFSEMAASMWDSTSAIRALVFEADRSTESSERSTEATDDSAAAERAAAAAMALMARRMAELKERNDSRAASARTAAAAVRSQASAERELTAATALEGLPSGVPASFAQVDQMEADEAAHKAHIERITSNILAENEKRRVFEIGIADARLLRQQEAADAEMALVQSVTNAAANAFATSFADALENAETFEDGMVSVLKSVGKAVLKSAAQFVAAEIQKRIASIATAQTSLAASAAEGAGKQAAAHANIPFVGIAIAAAAAIAMQALIAGFSQFRRGGIVGGGEPGRDSVPALLTPGEAVIPVGVTRQLQRALGGPASGGSETPAAAAPTGSAPGQMAGHAGGPAQSGAGVTVVFQSLLPPENSAELDRRVRMIGPALARARIDGASV